MSITNDDSNHNNDNNTNASNNTIMIIVIIMLIMMFIRQMRIDWNMPLNFIGRFQSQSTGQEMILWIIPLTSQIPFENATEHPPETATEHPRWFLRC